MYATVIEIDMKPDSKDEAIEKSGELMDEFSSKVEGIRGFMLLDRGDNKATAIVVYESKENWEAATSASAEILGQLAPYMAGVPERTGCEVMLAKRFATD